MILNPLKICSSSTFPGSDIYYENKLSSEEQRSITKNSISMIKWNKPNIQLIGGPPGAGKTTLIKDIILSLFRRQKLDLKETPKILICAKNNSAVDVLMKLICNENNEINPVRFGVNYVDRKLKPFSINSLIQNAFDKSYKFQIPEYKEHEYNVSFIV